MSLDKFLSKTKKKKSAKVDHSSDEAEPAAGDQPTASSPPAAPPVEEDNVGQKMVPSATPSLEEGREQGQGHPPQTTKPSEQTEQVPEVEPPSSPAEVEGARLFPISSDPLIALLSKRFEGLGQNELLTKLISLVRSHPGYASFKNFLTHHLLNQTTPTLDVDPSQLSVQLQIPPVVVEVLLEEIRLDWDNLQR